VTNLPQKLADSTPPPTKQKKKKKTPHTHKPNLNVSKARTRRTLKQLGSHLLVSCPAQSACLVSCPACTLHYMFCMTAREVSCPVCRVVPCSAHLPGFSSYTWFEYMSCKPSLYPRTCLVCCSARVPGWFHVLRALPPVRPPCFLLFPRSLFVCCFACWFWGRWHCALACFHRHSSRALHLLSSSNCSRSVFLASSLSLSLSRAHKTKQIPLPLHYSFIFLLSKNVLVLPLHLCTLLLLQCCCFLCFHRLRLEPQHCKKFPPPLLTLSSFPIPLISCLIVSFFFSP